MKHFVPIKKYIFNRKIIFACIGLILFFIFFIRPRFFTSQTTTSHTQVKRGDLASELTLSGKVDADEHVTLQFQTGGMLTYVGVKQGDFVKKGQLIASLDSRSIRKTINKYLNTYKKERSTFDQAKDDTKDSVLNDKVRRVLDENQSDLNNSVLDVELQSIALEFSNLYSPIDGVVTRVDSPLAGVNISAAAPAQFEIVDPLSLYFTVSADQTEVINLFEGQNGSVSFDAYPDEKIPGVISSIAFSPKKDETGTVYEVKVSIPSAGNANYKYRLGMTGDITFTTKEVKNVLYVPLSYVKTDNTGKYVYRDTKQTKQYIRTGLETDTDVEITNGLKEEDMIYD